MTEIYVIDSNSFRVFSNYYPDVFPSFWSNLEELVDDGIITSCREVKKELNTQNPSEHLNDWIDNNSGLFPPPNEKELEYVTRIFSIAHFRQLIGKKQQLRGMPVADPFLIARAAVLKGGVAVSEESYKPNAAKIPNVCEHFSIRCINVQMLFTELRWSF